MSDRKILIIAMLVVVAVVVGGGVGIQAWRTHRSPKVISAPAFSQPPVTITDGQPLRLGADTAPVTLSLYEDFHCPHCADFEEEFGARIDAAQQRGAARVELYPMAFIDEGSTSAANAVACAAESGFGAAYYAGLFGNANLQWSDAQLLDLPSKVGATSTPGFVGCVTGRTHQGWVESINAAAAENGVQGTPTVFLDAAPVDIEALTPETLDAMITDAAQG